MAPRAHPKDHPIIALGYFTLKALLLYPPHAIVMRLHGRDSYVVILIRETADLLGCRVAGLVGRIRHPGFYPGCPVPATGGSLP